MKKQILNLGVAATHQSITTLSNFSQEIAVSEFDAFVLDPNTLLSGLTVSNFQRRIREITDLVRHKGGNRSLSHQARQFRPFIPTEPKKTLQKPN